MELIKMIKKTLCALTISLASGLGCGGPFNEEDHTIPIPHECAEVKEFTYGSQNWYLLCKNKEGKDLFYGMTSEKGIWEKYTFVPLSLEKK